MTGQKLALMLCASAALAGASAMLVPAEGTDLRTGRSRDPNAAAQRNSSAIATILGEFRTNLSDLIFIKTERYLDSGVAYMPHIDTAALEGSGNPLQADQEDQHDHEAHARGKNGAARTAASTDDGKTSAVHEESLEKSLANARMTEAAQIRPGEVQKEEGHAHAHDDHEGHDHAAHNRAAHAHKGHDCKALGCEHAHVPTIIKTADEDFRGFIGNLEREIKPWRDPAEGHQHTAGTELLPWYRLGTYSDPKNVRMYMIGSWWLKTLRTPEQTMEALTFLDEGIAHNPNAFQLHYMRGYILRLLQRDAEAKQSFGKATELALKTRPADGNTSSPEWNLTMEEQLEGALSMHVLSVRDLEGTATAIELARKYKPHFSAPDNATTRLLRNLGATP